MNVKSLVITPGQKLIFVSKGPLSQSDMNHLKQNVDAFLGPDFDYLIVDGTQLEVVVLDERQVKGYIPTSMNEP